MKIVSIIGARPQFIKCASVSRELRKKHTEILVHTGQHYDDEMSGVFFRELNIPKPEYNLGVGSGTHGSQTGEMLKRIEEVLFRETPDLVIVYGDTNSTLAGALASAKLHIKTCHVEAGMRSYDMSMPEEINRVLSDHCSDTLFASTKKAIENLRKEGITEGVYFTGDVMVDFLKESIEAAQRKSSILEKLNLVPGEYFLATVHRAGNTDSPERLKNIVDALCEIENVVFPCHPRTEKMLKEFGLWEKINKNTKLIKPVSYLDMIALEKNSRKIITDSGGIQKEAYILRIPCITIRENTEWVETVEEGWNVLTDADREAIINAAKSFEPSGKQKDVFGDGNASKKIVRIISTIKENK